MSRQLHIVCLDAPSPPDYGGAIDMFYKVKALAQAGWRIHLHYFNYRQGRDANGLEEDCESIQTYERRSMLTAFPFSTPFIIGSRINQPLIQRLNADDHPILLEGLHCAGLVPQIRNSSRIILRMHNEEASYYQHLAQTESSLLMRSYFGWESRLLASYQKGMDKAVRLACLAQTDEEVFQKQFGFQQTAFIPCFIPWPYFTINTGRGAYCLYHGNLAVAENEQAALWLIRNVFHELPYPFIIAGKGISERLKKVAAEHRNISLVNNPSIAVIDGLVREAQINVLPSLNRTGVKLKLLNALFNGRHCITNRQGIAGSGIEGGVTIADNATAWRDAVNELMPSAFEAEELQQRKPLLQLYNNRLNAEKLSALW